MFKNTSFPRLLLLTFLLSGLAQPLFPAEQLSDNVEQMLSLEAVLQRPTLREKLIAKRVVEVLLNNHYQKLQMTPELSAQWYANYFRFLDFDRTFFLASDLEEFKSYETVLWDRRTRTANLEFAFTVYQRFLERVHEWAVFSIACLEQPHDFTTEEYIIFSTDSRQWAKSREELQDHWRKQVKNLLLLEQIRLAEEAEQATPTAAEPAAAAVAEPATAAAEPAAAAAEPAAAAAAARNGQPTASGTARAEEPIILRQKKNYARAYKRRLELEPIQIVEMFTSSFAQLFDPHSTYMAPSTKEDFDIDMSLSLQGIGASLTTAGAYTQVAHIIPGGPAEKSGLLKSGDRITAVAQDGEEPVDILDMPLQQVVSKIRGPKGTVVHLTILPEGSSTTQVISLTRDEIKLTDQEAQSECREISTPHGRKARVQIIYLPTFYSDFNGKFNQKEDFTSSARDVQKLLQQAQEQGPLDAVVLDLRGNGGGSLQEAVDLAGLFLQGGPVVQVRYYRGQIEKMRDPLPEAIYRGPLVVLVDKFSASASEIVAACLQDCGRALVLGDKSTHGKGTVQTLYDLDRDPQIQGAATILNRAPTGSLKITIGKFYRINGSSTQVRGVTPDIIFPAFSDYMEVGEERLPHVMPWDVISPTRFSTDPALVAQLPAWKQFAAKYLAESKDFQEYLQDLAFFGKLREQKQIPLNITARREYIKQEKAAGEMFRKFHAQRRQARKLRGAADDQNQPDPAPGKTQDLVLEATLAILGELHQPQPLAVSPAQTTPNHK
ncbi:MAG: carboxy terminal-processing peptidase [Oligosphaeraceae bacterium]|nr:carboxy terminal-processing peptidase [Oligosphaeraceae bacterium]